MKNKETKYDPKELVKIKVGARNIRSTRNGTMTAGKTYPETRITADHFIKRKEATEV